MTDAPSPFLRRLIAQKAVANEMLIDDLVDMSDKDLTEILLGVSVTPAHTPSHVDGLIHDLSKKHETNGYWIVECITARVLDRWLEENA